MSSHLLIEAIGRVPLIVVALGIAASLKALASVLQTWIEQESRTRRLAKALEDSKPSQRPGIITACSQLEGRPASEPGDGAADEGVPAPVASRAANTALRGRAKPRAPRG